MLDPLFYCTSKLISHSVFFRRKTIDALKHAIDRSILEDKIDIEVERIDFEERCMEAWYYVKYFFDPEFVRDDFKILHNLTKQLVDEL